MTVTVPTAVHIRLAATIIYVTHDQVEAMTLADRIVLPRARRIEQVGAPFDLLGDPDNLFVAGFLGSPRHPRLPPPPKTSKSPTTPHSPPRSKR